MFCAITGCTQKSFNANMQAVEAFLPTLEAAIATDEAFSDIRAFPTTAKGGAIQIDGSIASEHLARLHSIVESTSPPCPIIWSVNVLP